MYILSRIWVHNTFPPANGFASLPQAAPLQWVVLSLTLPAQGSHSLTHPKSSGFVCHLENVSSMYQTKLDCCWNQFQDALFSLSLSAFGCVVVAFRLEHHQRDGFPYLPSYIDESWWLHFVYSLSFQSGNIHISYSCLSLRLLPVSFRILHPLVPLPTPTWSCPSTYIYSGTWQNIPTPCQSLPNIFMRRLCTPE